MENKICCIISAGDCSGINYIKGENDFVIAADGGYEYAKKYNIAVDLILGDYDSLGYIPEGDNVIIHKPEKDDTDTMLAVKEGESRGYREFLIFGALGGRLDHTLANLQTLAYLSKKGYKAWIVGDKEKVTAITNTSIELEKKNRGIFSVFSWDQTSEGVSIKNAKYQVEGVRLKNNFPLGISNEYVGKSPYIKVENGTLIIIVSSFL